jgi:CRISPR system Cascade subunit CasD
MDILLLCFDAPLMSFGGVMVDQHGPTERFPGLSLLAGLFGNALGYCHGDAEKLEALQAQIEYAARWDIEPQPLLDYHTVDLGQGSLREPGWTTHGEPEHRGGGPDAKFGTHIRYRHYWANGVMTLAVCLGAAHKGERPLPLGEGGDDGTTTPNLDDLAAAMQSPARPLFLGRKTCLPAAPLLLRRVEADNVLDALRCEPLTQRLRSTSSGNWPERLREQEISCVEVQACWPARLGENSTSRPVHIYDRRDWRNQIHAGRRTRIEGWLELAP